MTQIYHAHLYGDRNSKYDWLQSYDVLSTDWQTLTPQAPFYLLIPQNTDLLGEYNQGWKITEAMPVNSMGITSGKDELFIAFNTHELHGRFDDKKKFLLVNYRPFDDRIIFYESSLLARSRSDFMAHFSIENNLAITTIRRPRNNEVDNFFICNKPADKCIISSLDNAQILPLYLYPDRNELTQDRRPNFSPQLLKVLTTQLGDLPSPETIFYYIYAVFHSPTYRRRYAEFLKIDFPRVSLTRNPALFQQLATYGEALVALHLMKSPTLDQFIIQYQGNPNPVVDAGHPKFLLPSPSGRGVGGEGGKVIINKKGDGFTVMPEEVWNFYVGGYQVCHKWLKDRKGRTLSPEDITHYQRIVVALQETIRLMQQIDAAIPGWPLE